MPITSQKITGKYFGTEINEKWYKRYCKNKMLARGNGIFGFSETAISFLRTMTSTPIVINLKEIQNIKTGTWHAGQWSGGKTIIKIVWEKDSLILSSGFSLSLTSDENKQIISELQKLSDSKNVTSNLSSQTTSPRSV